MIKNIAKHRLTILLIFILAILSPSPIAHARQSKEKDYIFFRAPDLSKVKSFKNVPMSDESGLVIESFTLPIPGMEDVYNPSMIKTEFGYCVAYRYDLPWDRVSFKKAKIGLLNVDEKFQPLGNPQFLNTRDDQVEDPRMLMHDNKCYVSYTHLTYWGKDYLCNIGMSNIDLETQKVTKNWELLYKKGPREKNWTPFSYRNEEGTSDLYFVYEYNPFKVIRLKSPLTGAIEHPFAPTHSPLLDVWEKKWGKVRGGTPPLLLETGDYLTFFHSCFRENSCLWYVIGAITFEGKPPFAIKSISQFPILYEGMYSTPILMGRNKALRALFPGGFAQETLLNGKEVFHVICGENDTVIKVITLDKELLFNAMNHVEN